ncbi:hypothetical protein AJ87_20150 [Rhizobium yanglingense]|nr:hypothetical protein AJ87_20150 [Rhizobium yanglingense]
MDVARLGTIVDRHREICSAFIDSGSQSRSPLANRSCETCCALIDGAGEACRALIDRAGKRIARAFQDSRNAQGGIVAEFAQLRNAVVKCFRKPAACGIHLRCDTADSVADAVFESGKARFDARTGFSKTAGHTVYRLIEVHGESFGRARDFACRILEAAGDLAGAFTQALFERPGAAVDRLADGGFMIFQRHFEHAGACGDRGADGRRLLGQRIAELRMGVAERKADRVRTVVQRCADAIMGGGKAAVDAGGSFAGKRFHACGCFARQRLKAVVAAGECRGERCDVFAERPFEPFLVVGISAADSLCLVGEGAGNPGLSTCNGIEECVGAGFKCAVEAALAIVERYAAPSFFRRGRRPGGRDCSRVR